LARAGAAVGEQPERRSPQRGSRAGPAPWCAVTVRLEIEYDGTDLWGWASQPGIRSVHGELQRALGIVLRAPTSLVVAGRTDRGVHAVAQVASYDGPLPDLYNLNAVLPGDVAV